MDLSNLHTKMYLTRTLLDKIFEKPLSNDDIDRLMLKGMITKKFSYYQATEKLLRKYGIIPDKIKLDDVRYNILAKKSSFSLRTIGETFGGCGVDTVRIIADRYFFRMHNYYYKNKLMEDMLVEGITTYET